jgi:hypothetical protein
MVRGFRWALALGVVIALWAPVISLANPDIEYQSRELVSRERTSRGIGPYDVQGELADVARRHAERMAREGRLYHNPNLANEVGGWDALGENVGRGQSADAIHQAFMHSETHRSEILSTTFTQVGIGAAVAADGEVWVAQVFRKPTPPPPPPPPAEPRPQPARVSRATPAPAPRAIAPPKPPSPPAAVPAPVLVRPPTTTTTVVVAPDLSALEGAFDAPRVFPPEVAGASITAAVEGVDIDVEPDVSLAVRVAATLLVGVVALQTRYVAHELGGLRVPMPLRRKLAAIATTLP